MTKRGKARAGWLIAVSLTLVVQTIALDHRVSADTAPPEEPPELAMYAEAFGVPLAEVRQQWDASDDAGRLQQTLSKSEGDVFGGLWIQHLPTFQVVVRVLPGSEARIQQYVDEIGLTGVTRIVPTQTTLKQLETDQAALRTLIPREIDYASGIKVSEGTVRIWVETSAEAAL